jgi:hypothetical protein
VGIPPPEVGLATVAVNVTNWPKLAGLDEEVSVVVVVVIVAPWTTWFRLADAAAWELSPA